MLLRTTGKANSRPGGYEGRKEKKMYMSYCRFEGTRQELQACFGEVYDHINEEAEYEVSDHEIREFRNMVRNMVEFLQDTEILDENGEVNERALDEVCETMRYGYSEEE